MDPIQPSAYEISGQCPTGSTHNYHYHYYTAVTAGLSLFLKSFRFNGRLTGNSSSSGGTSHSSKKTRRRVATMAQRRAANIRERRRMFNLNEAFDKLRRKVNYFLVVFRCERGCFIFVFINFCPFKSARAEVMNFFLSP